jgi:frataxin
MPDTDNPAPRKAEEHDQSLTPADLTPEEYHEIADQYLEKLILKLEQKQEETNEIDAELVVRFHSLATFCKTNLFRME